MAISTNSIIHYTLSFDVLCKILDEGFKLKYCGEKLDLGTAKGSNAAHPMVSFCDIPLTESSAHFKSYGFYGIGLYKEWAFRKELNPVLYIEKNSYMAKSLSSMIECVRQKDSGSIGNEMYLLKAFTKNYSGNLVTSTRKEKNYIFYNEREWRYVPQKEDIESTISTLLSYYEENKDSLNAKIANFRLKFEPQDISYIIVKSTNEIPDIIRYLKDIYSDRCTAKELDILFSKICSTEQILSDY